MDVAGMKPMTWQVFSFNSVGNRNPNNILLDSFITSNRSNLKWSDSPQSRLFQNSGAIQLLEVFLPVEHRDL